MYNICFAFPHHSAYLTNCRYFVLIALVSDIIKECVVGSQSIKVEEAIAFLQANQKNGWVNLDIKQSKGGKYYCQLDTWQPKPKSEKKDVMEVVSEKSDELPF